MSNASSSCCLRCKSQAQLGLVWGSRSLQPFMANWKTSFLEFRCVPQSYRKVEQAQFCTFVAFWTWAFVP